MAAVYTYPLVFRLSTAVLRRGRGDCQMETSIVAWNAHQILRDPLGLHDLPFYYSRTVAYSSRSSSRGSWRPRCHVLWGVNFDTFKSPAESRRRAERIATLQAGTIVEAARISSVARPSAKFRSKSQK